MQKPIIYFLFGTLGLFVLSFCTKPAKIESSTLWEKNRADTTTLRLLNDTIFQLIKRGHYQRAFEHNTQLLDLYQEAFAPNDSLLGQIYLGRTDLYRKLSKPDSGLVAGATALKHFGSFYGDIFNTPSAKALNLIGTLHRDIGQFDKAMVSHEAALEQAIQASGPQSRDVISILSNIGAVKRCMKKYGEALALQFKALSLVDSLVDMDTDLDLNFRPKIHNQIGNVYRLQGAYDKALDHYEISLKQFTDHYGEQPPEQCSYSL